MTVDQSLCCYRFDPFIQPNKHGQSTDHDWKTRKSLLFNWEKQSINNDGVRLAFLSLTHSISTHSFKSLMEMTEDNVIHYSKKGLIMVCPYRIDIHTRDHDLLSFVFDHFELWHLTNWKKMILCVFVCLSIWQLYFFYFSEQSWDTIDYWCLFYLFNFNISFYSFNLEYI